MPWLHATTITSAYLDTEWSELTMDCGLYILVEPRLNVERFSINFEYWKLNHFLYTIHYNR